MVPGGRSPRSAGSPSVGDPAVSKRRKQTCQNLVSRHNFPIIDIINIKANKPFCALPRWERCLRDARVEARAEFLSAVVIATGAAVHRQQLCNSCCTLKSATRCTKASEQQRQPKTHGHGQGGWLSGMARAPWCNAPASGALAAPQAPLHRHPWAQTHKKASPVRLLCLHSPQSVQSTLHGNNTDARRCPWK